MCIRDSIQAMDSPAPRTPQDDPEQAQQQAGEEARNPGGATGRRDDLVLVGQLQDTYVVGLGHHAGLIVGQPLAKSRDTGSLRCCVGDRWGQDEFRRRRFQLLELSLDLRLSLINI